MTKLNSITLKGKFDAGHRIMNERFKCYNIHGHEFCFEMTYEYKEVLGLGYAIDFNEIKRIASQWIDDTLDHAFIANPKDSILLDACEKTESKLYQMKLVDNQGDCNPSCENIAKEVFFAVSFLMNNENVRLSKFVLYESSNCYATCVGLNEDDKEQLKSNEDYIKSLSEYKKTKGSVEYDRRKT